MQIIFEKHSINSYISKFISVRSSIYHFDPTNLPQCSKLQIMAASPTSTTPTAPSPTFAPHEAAQTRKKYKPKPNTVRDDDDDGGPNANCDNDGTSSGVVRNSSNPEIEISSLPCNNSDNSGSISEAPAPITMNTLLAPINQIHAEICSNSGADNDSDGRSKALEYNFTLIHTEFFSRTQILPVNDVRRRRPF